jgi:PPOX class probable F420-dependent enzyme
LGIWGFEDLEAAMASIPQSHADLFDKKAFANLATINADGSPQVTPVWWDSDGTNILVNTAKGRVKANNLARNPRVALTIADPENPYRYVGIQGRVVEMTEKGADAHINALTRKYIGKDEYPYRQPGEVRLIIKIKPEKVHTNR